MIIDCHTHIWSSIEQLGRGSSEFLLRQSGQEDIPAGPESHLSAMGPVDISLVSAYRSKHLLANVPNELIEEYVSTQSDRLIGIAAVDPTEDDAVAQGRELLKKKEFCGITISPSSQNFHPADSRAMKLYEMLAKERFPLFVHQGTHFPSDGSMEYARPLLLDEIAREFPSLTIVISALGNPWIEEAIALIGKHPRVYAGIASLIRRPWQAYNALVLAHQFNVVDKVLFGSDFPFYTAADAIESVYRLHEVTQGTNLPSVPREILRSMIERDSLVELGIPSPQND